MRDPRRTFSKEEKLVAAWEQDWKTPEGKTIEFDDLLNTDKIQGGHDKHGQMVVLPLKIT